MQQGQIIVHLENLWLKMKQRLLQAALNHPHRPISVATASVCRVATHGNTTLHPGRLISGFDELLMHRRKARDSSRKTVITSNPTDLTVERYDGSVNVSVGLGRKRLKIMKYSTKPKELNKNRANMGISPEEDIVTLPPCIQLITKRDRCAKLMLPTDPYTCPGDLTLMSGAELFMREDVGLTDGEVEVLAGSMNVFMLASILAAGWVADHLGRRRTLVLANAFLMAGALAMSLGTSFAALMAARFVTSVGSGFARRRLGTDADEEGAGEEAVVEGEVQTMRATDASVWLHRIQ
ncbi:Rap1-interacting factor 1 amino-terminal protein [Zea mays]|uniref:Rap1-interacting factor 1 amino-terminal protein n=1 Tax=Zea mays TaxID=4577 RepID=A0A1D6IJH0_MAIZE|nr:Rap1-interacting factor 1 amino-terminal protein [Zea mays]